MSCTEITECLHRNFPAAGFIGCLFQLPLKSHTAQDTWFPEILRPDCDNEGTVGIAGISCLIAHSIDRQHSFFRGSVHHIASRAHTEAVDSAAGVCLMCHFVTGRTQIGILLLPIQGLINQFLGMFHTHLHGKSLGLHGNLPLVEHGESIPGTMSNGKDTHLSRNLLSSSENHTRQTAILQPQIGNLCLKTKFPAHGLNLSAESLHDGDQKICAKMRLLFVENFFWRSSLYKSSQHLFVSPGRIFHQSVEFSI